MSAELTGLSYFRQVDSRSLSPRMRVDHSVLFGAVPVSEVVTSSPGDPEIIGFVKNICSPAEVFRCNVGRLVLTRAVALRLPQRSQALLRPIVWERAYRMPFAAGDVDYRKHPLFDPEAERAEEFILTLAQAEPYPVPDPHGFVCWHHDAANPLDMQVRHDATEVVFPAMPEGLLATNLQVSPQAIAENGIGWSWGWVCDEEVMHVLDPHLLRPYFIVLTCERDTWRIRPAPPGTDVGETRFT